MAGGQLVLSDFFLLTARHVLAVCGDIYIFRYIIIIIYSYGFLPQRILRNCWLDLLVFTGKLIIAI